MCKNCSIGLGVLPQGNKKTFVGYILYKIGTPRCDNKYTCTEKYTRDFTWVVLVFNLKSFNASGIRLNVVYLGLFCTHVSTIIESTSLRFT